MRISYQSLWIESQPVSGSTKPPWLFSKHYNLALSHHTYQNLNLNTGQIPQSETLIKYQNLMLKSLNLIKLMNAALFISEQLYLLASFMHGVPLSSLATFFVVQFLIYPRGLKKSTNNNRSRVWSNRLFSIRIDGKVEFFGLRSFIWSSLFLSSPGTL